MRFNLHFDFLIFVQSFNRSIVQFSSSSADLNSWRTCAQYEHILYCLVNISVHKRIKNGKRLLLHKNLTINENSEKCTLNSKLSDWRCLELFDNSGSSTHIVQTNFSG